MIRGHDRIDWYVDVKIMNCLKLIQTTSSITKQNEHYFLYGHDNHVDAKLNCSYSLFQKASDFLISMGDRSKTKLPDY